jgi:hypothetical protein
MVLKMRFARMISTCPICACLIKNRDTYYLYIESLDPTTKNVSVCGCVTLIHDIHV